MAGETQTRAAADEDVAFAGAARQAEMVRAGEVSPTELVRLSLGRIERLDTELNAFRKVFAEKALLEAEQAEARLKAGEERPLLGVPIAIKDEVDVAGEINMNGTDGFTEPAKADSEMVRRLREAGAIVVGLTRLPEIAICGFTESATQGVTRNPWNLQRSPGGSSGGSAAAVAAGIVPVASAGDGAGSIRIPASSCGLFGLKPSRGRISLAPLDQGWTGLAVLGCVSRTRARHGALARHHGRRLEGGGGAAATGAPLRRVGEDRAREAASRLVDRRAARRGPADGLRGRQAGGAGDGRAARLARARGHPARPGVGQYRQQHHAALPARRLGRRSTRCLTLSAWKGARAVSGGSAATFRRGSSSGRCTAALSDARRVNAIFDHCDVLITPVMGGTALPIRRWEGQGALRTVLGMSRFYPYCVPWNHLGNPAMAVPAGFDADGMPLSVQVIGRPGDEATLLSLAAQLEAERPWADVRPAVS